MCLFWILQHENRLQNKSNISVASALQLFWTNNHSLIPRHSPDAWCTWHVKYALSPKDLHLRRFSCLSAQWTLDVSKWHCQLFFFWLAIIIQLSVFFIKQVSDVGLFIMMSHFFTTLRFRFILLVPCACQFSVNFLDLFSLTVYMESNYCT